MTIIANNFSDCFIGYTEIMLKCKNKKLEMRLK